MGGEGAANQGEKGGKEKGWPPRVLWEKETTPRMTFDFASNGPQPFSHIHSPKINFWVNIFWDITLYPP